MENREILVANTKTQKKYKLFTDVTTLGALKEVLDNNNNVQVLSSNGQWVANAEPIDYTGMTFTEGISKLSLLDDSSPLPENVSYQGRVTNNLVMILTNTKKNVASGSSRAEAYAIIKEDGLQDAVYNRFGCNYTNVSTANLWQFIDELDSNDEEEDDYDEDYDEQDEVSEDTPVKSEEAILDALYGYVKFLLKEDYISPSALGDFAEVVAELSARTAETGKMHFQTSAGNITEEDIDNMISSVSE